MPEAEEGIDLFGVQVLNHEVPEVGVAKSLRTVTHNARSDDESNIRVLVTEAVNVVENLLAPDRVEDFVQSVQQHHNAILLVEQMVERLPVQPVPRRCFVHVTDKVLSGRAFPAVVIPQFDQDRQPHGISLFGVFDPRPPQRKKAQQRRLARTRITENYGSPSGGIVDDFQHGP
jgi:hypothetical protein